MDGLKFGRRPPKRAPALMMDRLLTGVVPPHPLAVDYLAALPSWQMLGNDKYGDCVAVTWANTRRLVSSALGSPSYPTLAAVIDLYKTQNPGFPTQDDGMDIQTCLEYLVKTGGPDGVKAVAFAKVNARERDQLEAAVAIFGSVWTGINVQAAQMDQFDKGQPWDFVARSPDDGGHSVIVGGYTGQAKADLRFITWAQETSFSDLYIAHEFEEAWVVIWPEHFGVKAFLDGVNIDALAADFKALTGDVLVIPPQPAPVNPNPLPDPADATFAAALKPWVAARHSGTNKTAATAAKAWLKAKGL